jgi:hypothetical protein
MKPDVLIVSSSSVPVGSRCCFCSLGEAGSVQEGVLVPEALRAAVKTDDDEEEDHEFDAGFDEAPQLQQQQQQRHDDGFFTTDAALKASAAKLLSSPSSSSSASATRQTVQGTAAAMTAAKPFYPGSLMGFFDTNKQVVYCHENCAAWSPEVCCHAVPKTGVAAEEEWSWCNLVPAYARSRRLFCTHCHRGGATVGCFEPTCVRNYHVSCAAMWTAWDFQRHDQGKHYRCHEHRNTQT